MATKDSFLSVRPQSWAFAVFGSIGDPEGTRTVTSIIVLLVAIGLALVMLAVWLHRKTRPDPELLAPLEMMGERKWRRSDPVWQRRRLDEIRPDGARPVQPSIAPPEIDLAFEAGPTARGFDDLHDVALAADDAPLGGSQSDDRDETAPTSIGNVLRGEHTPPAIGRPSVDELPDGEFDPDLMAAAIAELDAEFGNDRA